MIKEEIEDYTEGIINILQQHSSLCNEDLLLIGKRINLDLKEFVSKSCTSTLEEVKHIIMKKIRECKESCDTEDIETEEEIYGKHKCFFCDLADNIEPLIEEINQLQNQKQRKSFRGLK